MRPIWKKSVKYLIFTVIVLGLVAFFVIKNLEEYQIKVNSDKLLTSTTLIADALKPMIEEGRIGAIQRYVRELGSKTQIRTIVTDRAGKILADSFKGASESSGISEDPEFISAVSGKTGLEIRKTGEKEIDSIFVATAIHDQNNSLIAVVRTSIPLNHPTDIPSPLIKNLVIAGIIVLIIVFILSMASARRYNKSLEAVIAVTEQLAGGNFGVNIPLKEKRGERGKLGLALGSMAETLEYLFNEADFEKNRLGAVLSAMTEGVLAVSNDGKVVLINESFKEMFQIEDVADDKPYWEIIRNREVLELLEGVLEKNEEDHKEINLFHPSDKTYYIKAHPINKPSLGAIVILFDVSEFKLLEKIKADFVANVSHELRTPLAAMQGYVETLEDEAYDDEEQRKRFLGIIKKHNERLINIVNDLLVLSEIESTTGQWSGYERREFEEIDLVEVLHNSIDALRAKVESKKLDLSIDLPLRAVSEGDPFLLEQMFINLIDNAVKYSPVGKSIKIKLEESDKTLKVEIEDTGIGIPPEHIQRIFERFYRVDKARSSTLGGTGLGLSIVKHIAIMHGGNVEVKSRLDVGSTFSVTIPALRETS